jgi:hypothetical protein
VVVLVQRVEGSPLQLDLLELGDGSGYLVRTGSWLAEVSAAQARGLIEDVTALPAP